MRTQTFFRSALTFGGSSLLAGIVVLSGCRPELTFPVNQPGPQVRAAKAAATTDMTVSAATPDSATQDTTLDVTISGSGFVAGTSATWALSGVADSTQVRTNRTTYVSSRQIVANITISATATVAKWDVVVSAAGKKGGIGSDAFTIKTKQNVDTDSRANIVIASSVNVAPPGNTPVMGPSGVQGDSRDKNGSSSTISEYQGNFCGVRSKIFSLSVSGDLVFGPATDYSTQINCGAARSIELFMAYQPGGPLGSPISVATFSNVRAVLQMSDGQIKSQRFVIEGTGVAKCDRLAFDATIAGSSNVQVTRLPDAATGRRWKTESLYPHMASCLVFRTGAYVPTGVLKYLPFSFTATEIPYPYPSNP